MHRLIPFLCAPAFACAGPTGDLTVLLEAEDSIPEGLSAGTGDEDIVDGWSVSFDRYLVAIGDVALERTTDGLRAGDETVYVVDLAALPVGGMTITELEALQADRWDRFAYATPTAAGATRHDSAAVADYDEMVAGELTYLLEGTLTSEAGESCPPGGACRPTNELRFRLGVAAPTRFGPCEAEEGLSGVTITEGGTTASITIHGDHVFFDGFPSGAEVIERRAQWLADADLDGDDVITTDELTEAPASGLFPSSLYNLAGAPIEIRTGLDYLRSQLATQGHFQGEGECPWALETGG